MKRKLIRQGNNSVTLTLPLHWARERGLGQGGEVEIVPSGEYLVLGTKTTALKRSIEVDVTNQSSAVKKLLASLYRAGFDEIIFNITNAETEQFVKEMLWQDLVGFELIKLQERKLCIKSIADLDPESFSTLFKKSFLLLMNFSNEIIDHLQQKKADLSRIQAQDTEINKITNLCYRLLSKKMNDRRKIVVYAAMLRNMEKLGDCFKELAMSTARTKKISSESLAQLRELTQKLRKLFFLLYGKFDVNELLALNDELRTLNRSLDKATRWDTLQRYYHSIMQKMESLTGGVLILNLENLATLKKEDWVC